MDWNKLISDLQAAGMSQSAIGAELGKTQGWVSAALRGDYVDLKWSDGQALIALHHAKVHPGRKTKLAA